MPLFISEEEFRRCSDDSAAVAEKADGFIRELYRQIETVKAEADASSITLEQTSSLIEQKYVSLSAEYSSLESQNSELSSSLEQRSLELGQVQSEKQKLLLQSIEKDGEIERLTREASELHKSKRQLMEVLEQKDLEISEKTTTVKSYLDKIVNLNENAASKEARLSDLESELGRLNATCARCLQEKELLERHNTWLNDELTAKVDSLIQLRKENGELESNMSSKLADVEMKFKENSSSLKLQKDIVRELEEKLAYMERELLSTKDAAAAAEERFSAEISTVTKLVDLYKESSEEWSKKAGELEGVIQALETHLNQVENEYKDKLEHEVSVRKEVEKESADLKEKLQTCEAELKNLRKENEQKHLPLSSFTTDSWVNSADTSEMAVDDRAIVPRIVGGVSGTALATSLLSDGWTLTRMYAKYQEAVDALQHEQLGRKQSQAILERVLYEIEEKAGVIMDEREEHEKIAEAYSALDQKLQHSLSQHSALETTIQELRASLKRQERDYASAQKEIVDLEKQVAVLLKECRDVQLRCGSVARCNDDGPNTGPAFLFNAESNAENIISERLLTFKDINGLVEQNVQLRSLVRHLSDQIEEKEAELKDKYEKELQMHTNDTASKVNAVLLRAEDQAHMIESLHASVALYKKLYEEEHKLHSSHPHTQEAVPERRSRDVMLLQGSSHDTSRKVQEQDLERMKNLEEDLAKSRNDLISLRAERDKLALETQFAQERLARFMKEYDHQREEHNALANRNIEFSNIIVEYQKKLRESSESVDASNELSRKLTTEISILKIEKETLQNAEKKASDEVRSLTERVHRLQATLDTIQSTEEVREEARRIERRKQEEYINKLEREWADAKRELQEERDNVRNRTLERESNWNNASRQVEELTNRLANSAQAVAAAESRAAVAEARYSDLVKIMESARTKDSDHAEDSPSSSSSEKILANLRDEVEKLRGEAQASKDHMHQYKSIAQVNEEALKHIESAYENFRNEADEVKRSLETELRALREQVNELENECKLKTEEAYSATTGKEEALSGALSEIASLKNDCSVKISQIVVMESQISALQEDLKNEHQRWRAAQDNYERQVILQSETIQELTKTSQALASVQDETSELRQVVDLLKTENSELKSKWETEKLAIEVYKNEADKKYSEVDEANKTLLNHLEAFHIKQAEKERGMASGSSSLTLAADDGFQNVVNYLRRSKEIAETRISLLNQEKHRLQSQLESALKSAEAAQASLHSERAKSRASLLNEEDFKSIQLQVRELNLLRESNVQLREENRHNFEECQKLRETLHSVKVETENLEKLVRDRDTDLEASRKEIEVLKMEKVNLEKRVDELVEKCKIVDVDDYNRMKESLQQMQASIREKDSQLEEIKKVLSEKQDSITLLERDLARSRTELNERENRINEFTQAEASLKSEVEKMRRLSIQAKRKLENSLKEKEELSKEIQSLSKQLEDAKQQAISLSKQLEDAKQQSSKRNSVDSAGEQALREKEKEKDTRIQILERTLERHRDELKKERDDNQREKEKNKNVRKTIIESREKVGLEQAKLSDELKKHRQALKALQDEVEKLTNNSSGGSQSESIANSVLEDFASAYFQAVENFEQLVQPVCGDPDPASAGATSSEAPTTQSMDNTSSVIGQTASQTPTAVSVNVVPPPLVRTNEEEKRRQGLLARANIKTGRKLVRPSITKPKVPQRAPAAAAADVDMSEAAEVESTNQNTESQGLARKRPSSSDMQEDNNPDLKKSRAFSDGPQDNVVGDEQPQKLPEVVVPPVEESADDDGTKDEQPEPVDGERDEVEAEVEVEEEEGEQGEIAEEKSDEQTQTEEEKTDEQIVVAESGGGDKEEGEMDADFADNNDGDDSNISNEIGGTGEFQADQSVEPEGSPINETLTTLEAGEIDEMTEVAADPIAAATTTTEEASTSAAADVAVGSEQGGPVITTTPPQGDKPVSPVNNSGTTSSTTTTINLQERARARAQLRQSGMASSSSSSPNRGTTRGARVLRGRGRGRGPRGGQSPGQ